MLSGLASDLRQLAAGHVSLSWLREAGVAAGTRLSLRPLLAVFLNPTLLSPALRRNPAVRKTERVGLGANSWGPYDAHQNTFLPFETGKHQFRSMLVFARSLSALIRTANAFWTADSNPERVNAWAVGDCVGDSVELLLLSNRYGGGVRRGLIALNVLQAAFYLRVLLLKRDGRFAAALQTLSVASIAPMWYYQFTCNAQKTRRYSLVNYLLLTIFCAPKLFALVRSLLDRKMDPESSSEAESWDTTVSLAVAAMVGISLISRIRASFALATTV